MALTSTTLSSAVAVSDTTIVVASATGFAAGSFVIIDQELLKVVQTYVSGTTIGVLRGQNGTVTGAHVASAVVTVGLASDFATPAAEVDITYPTVRARTMTSYTASGAITLPTAGSDTVAVINGTATLTMTIANPTKDMDGCILYVISGGKSVSTVTYTAGFGNAGSSYDVATLPAGGQTAMQMIACNGFWLLLSPMTGTLTSAVPALA